MRKDKFTHAIRIVKFIENNPNTHMREIARNLDLNPATVHRILKELQEFLIFRSLNQEVDRPLPNMPVLIKLKDGITTEGIVRYLKVKERLRKIEKI